MGAVKSLEHFAGNGAGQWKNEPSSFFFTFMDNRMNKRVWNFNRKLPKMTLVIHLIHFMPWRKILCCNWEMGFAMQYPVRWWKFTRELPGGSVKQFTCGRRDASSAAANDSNQLLFFNCVISNLNWEFEFVSSFVSVIEAFITWIRNWIDFQWVSVSSDRFEFPWNCWNYFMNLRNF